MSRVYGYCRVSAVDQNEDRQMDAMMDAKIATEQVFVDRQSGFGFDRPAYQLLLERLEQGDLLYIKSIDRLGRNYEEIQNQWRVLTKERGVDIVVLDMPLLDTRVHKDLMGTFISDLILQLLSFVAHNERDVIRKRQAEGIAAAKKRGVRFGRPVKTPPEGFAQMVKDWERGKTTLPQILEQTGLSESTFYRRLRELRAGKKK